MALRDLCKLLCIAFLVTSTAYAQEINHRKPGDPPGTAVSRFNTATKSYEPVAWDKSYTYYRLKVNLNETFMDAFAPDQMKPTLIQVVSSGDVFDNSTGIKAGTFDSSAITTRAGVTLEVQYMGTVAVELGPNGDDTIFLVFALEQANFDQDPTDSDLAVVGGTGRYKGATGEAVLTGTDTTKPVNLYVADIAVPRFKRF